jgi:hypothetical protein
MTAGRFGAGWEQFWFEQVRPELYALLRIGGGLVGLAGLVGLTPVDMYWVLDGLAPVPGGGVGLRQALLESGFGTAAGWALFVLLCSSFMAMTFGWQSRLAVFVCFAGSVLQAQWNHLPLSSAHQALIAFLFCLVWVDTGAAWSIDRWLDRGRDDVTSLRHQPVWPLRLLQFQVALIYVGSGVSKVLDPLWRDGTAVSYVVNNNVFHRFPVSLPAVAEPVLTAATYVTLAWELGFGLMMLHPLTRRAALGLGVLLHLGMWSLLELGTFSWVMVISYLAFLDPDAVARRIGSWPASPGRLRVEVNA